MFHYFYKEVNQILLINNYNDNLKTVYDKNLVKIDMSYPYKLISMLHRSIKLFIQEEIKLKKKILYLLPFAT